ncbi:MAG: hypothetical protein PHV79_01895 [Clostridia bacterium]|nr:hypothetical protein [Clostridia bacterium]MDD3862590.1 hypothetical protein [Clostridia bacterium]
MKKRQLLLSFIVISMAIILIPVSLWAANFLMLGVSNRIIFIVEDIEGVFSYQIAGNAIPGNNISYSPGNIFTASYNELNDRYILENSIGEEISGGIVISKPEGGLNFDVDNMVITYTFSFINLGKNDISISVASDNASENNLAANNVQTSYTYEVFETTNNTVPYIPDYSTSAKIPAGKSFETLIQQKDENSQTYEYIVFSYELKLTNPQAEYFSTTFEIGIDLKANV